jgi:hypothetical protein
MRNRLVNTVDVYITGIQEGWNQPYDLSTTRNVEHVPTFGDAVSILDYGCNLGQYLRAGTASQAAEEHYPIIPKFWKR